MYFKGTAQNLWHSATVLVPISFDSEWWEGFSIQRSKAFLEITLQGTYQGGVCCLCWFHTFFRCIFQSRCLPWTSNSYVDLPTQPSSLNTSKLSTPLIFFPESAPPSASPTVAAQAENLGLILDSSVSLTITMFLSPSKSLIAFHTHPSPTWVIAVPS